MNSTPLRPPVNGYVRGLNGLHTGARRGASITRDAPTASSIGTGAAGEEEERDDPIHRSLSARWAENQAAIAALFSSDGQIRRVPTHSPSVAPATLPTEDASDSINPRKRPARVLDEDYGDDDEDEEDDDDEKNSPLKHKGKPGLPSGLSYASRAPPGPVKPPLLRHATSAVGEQAKNAEDVRRQLEEDKKAAAEAAKRNFQGMFFTLENDRDAMLEQQKLDELDREVENEISGDNAPNGPTSAGPEASPGRRAAQGTLGSADLGASSLTLKHLIARIDAQRGLVQASDNQLRTLISEVRKGRSKWASEDRVGQEELYEASEKVLMELKAMTEYAQPFLQRVSKREAPDYFNVIKNPMDIGTMIKKLKQLTYKSKKDFVDDLNLIWTNCLKYNQEQSHPLRKKAIYMRKETDKLTPLIPEIVIRDRAEVEAEERRLQSMGADDSDDEDVPIMNSRGRKAPKKGGPSTGRKAPKVVEPDDKSTPQPEGKPALHASASSLRNEFLRADSEMVDGNSVGNGTPPPGSVNGTHENGILGAPNDVQEVDGLGHTMVSMPSEDLDEDDTEFKTWKQVTKKDRAQAAAERNRLFRGGALNLEEPALLRSKAGMRRWIRQQKATGKPTADGDSTDDVEYAEEAAGGETLAEGIETEEDSTLPDYYDAVAALPDLDTRLRWTNDTEGFALNRTDEFMRLFPRQTYTSTPTGSLCKRIEANMKQMQDTRQICAKIGIVKQMQIQAQTYQNQFQKYEPQPFVEQDVGAVVVSEDGPLMSLWLNRAAFQRAVGKIFYHAGFEDFQPSALDTVTDLASTFMQRMMKTFKVYHEQPKKADRIVKFSFEEQCLHTLDENGMDIEALESYIRDDVERLGSKLGVMHERMKSHLADLFRPALGDHAGADGVGAFNDGSEQFVGGDFAEDLGEDFFGFRELGLADEFGLETLSVPLHLLQNRMHNAYQAQNQGPVISSGLIFEPPADYGSITLENLGDEIGLVQDFFRNKILSHRDHVLIEDEHLPMKQRFPKPRLPPTGKISSPRKRPLREQQQAAKKKRKLEESKGVDITKTVGPLKLLPTKSTKMERDADGDMQDINANEIEKEGEMNGPMSPESING